MIDSRGAITTVHYNPGYVMNQIWNKTVRWDWFRSLLFTLVFCDALVVYFTGRFGFTRVNIIPAGLYLFYLLLMGPSKVLPAFSVLAWGAVLWLGFLMGFAVLPGIGPERLLELASATIAFLVGYVFFRNMGNEGGMIWFFTLLTLAYGVVSLLALLKIAPNLFPLEIKLWSDNGIIRERPAVMTDQNFEVFYLLPAAALIALPAKIPRVLLVWLSVGIGLYVLAKLQTRSGMLVIAGIIALSLYAPLKIRSLGRTKVMILPVLLGISLIFALPYVITSASLLIERFTNQGMGTAYGRLHSLLYFFEHVWNPLWWIPHGNSEFLKMTGNVPHSNITAVFLEGGLFGLSAWVALVILPLWRYLRLFMWGELDNIGTMIMLMGLGVFVIQMSLNVPVMDQVWLWAGSVVGGLDRAKKIARQKKAHASGGAIADG